MQHQFFEINSSRTDKIFRKSILYKTDGDNYSRLLENQFIDRR
jgi:hypothetical protein